MRRFTRAAATCLLVCVTAESALAVDSKSASYFGGTVTAFADAKNPVEGVLNTKDEQALIFIAEDEPFKGQTLSIRPVFPPCAPAPHECVEPARSFFAS